MKHFSILLFLCFEFFFLIPTVYSQESPDTIQYVMADTAKARLLLEEGKFLLRQWRLDDAEEKISRSNIIFLQTLGKESKETADTWHQLGLVYFYKGNYVLAKKNTQKALNIRLSIFSEKHLDVAAALNNLGLIYGSIGEYDQAIFSFQESLEIRLNILGPDHQDIAKSYNNLGQTYFSKSEYDQAIENFKKTIYIFSKALGEESLNLAIPYYNLGNLYTIKGGYDEAFDYHQKALNIRLNFLGDTHPQVGDSYSGLGIMYLQNGLHKLSIKFHLKALGIFRKVYGKVHPVIANSYSSLGYVYKGKGEYNKALEFYNNALNIRLKIFGGQHPTVGSSYGEIGNIYQIKGSYDQSIEYLLKALKLEIDKVGQYNVDVANSYNILGNNYLAKGLYDQAMAYQLKALNIREKIFGSNHPDVADSYNNLGLIYYGKKEFGKSLKSHHDALKIRLNTFGQEHSTVGQSYNNIGSVYYDNGNFNKAIEAFEKSIEIKKHTLGGGHPEVASTYINLAKCYSVKKMFSYSQESIDTAITFLNASNPFILTALQTKAISFRNQFLSNPLTFFLRQSNSVFKQAFSKLNYQFKTLSPASRSTLVEAAVPIYQGALQTNQLLSQETDSLHYLQESFDLAERSKALLLYQSIQESDALNFAGIPDSLLDKEYDLRVDIAYYDKKRQEKLSEGLEATDTTVLEISSELFDVQREYEALKQRFETDYPAYYQLKYDLTTASLDYVQDTLLAKDQSLLEYFVGDSSIFIFLVKQDDYEVLEIEKDFPLEDWIKQLQNGLFGFYNKAKPEQSDALYKSTLKDYIQAATQLYDKLLAPVEDNLTKDIILIPDGVLGYVPFEALLKDRPKSVSNFDAYPFLQRDHQLSYCYSATLLREMKEKQHQQEPSKSIVAFAPFYEGSYAQLDSTFNLVFDTLDNGQDTVFMVDVQTRKEFQQLPNSGEEVKVATQLWNGDYFLNSDATEDQFYQVAGDYRIVHLSTHGLADPRVGDYSYLAFAEQSDSLENEYLYVRDLYNTQLNADLVVLSACETALGELQRGEGIISLARAFAYAGAKSILTTLWVVDDAASKELTKEFYVQLKKGKSKDEALYLAKQKQLAHPENRQKHPFFWAAMIGVGDMSPID